VTGSVTGGDWHWGPPHLPPHGEGRCVGSGRGTRRLAVSRRGVRVPTSWSTSESTQWHRMR
jgi:hypothetical protein